MIKKSQEKLMKKFKQGKFNYKRFGIAFIINLAIVLAILLIGFKLQGKDKTHGDLLCNYLSTVDGDTIKCDMSHWHPLFKEMSIRLRGFDTPELRGGTLESKARAQEAKVFTKNLCEGPKTVVKSMNNEKDQKTFDKHLTIV